MTDRSDADRCPGAGCSNTTDRCRARPSIAHPWLGTIASLGVAVLVVALPVVSATAATLILNEYNAVSSSNWLNGGTAVADDDGGTAGDLTFGRVLGNGGDWFELVLTESGVDLRGWQLDIYVLGVLDTTLVLSQHPLWNQLQAGTIITVAEDQAEDVSYDPGSGDWSINVRADTGASGAYITASSFAVNNDDWQIVIRDDQGATIYGPSGEGTVATGGVNSSEIWRLEENPSVFIVESSLCYDDADTHSSFGLPNVWSSGTKVQDFGPLRTGGAPTSQCDGSDLTPLAFDPTHILDVDVVIDPADWELLRKEQRGVMQVFGGNCGAAPPPNPYNFYSADVTVDGTTVVNAGVRKKGFFGSLSRQKPSLKIDFGEFGNESKIYGMERLTLNNGRQDPSLIDMCLGYDLYRAAGLVAPRCSFAHVKVNGTSLGVYVNVESIKDPFLVRNYGSSTGNLYEGTTADFRPNWIDVFEKKNNMDGSELVALEAALQIQDDVAALAAVQAVVDFDRFLTFWALDGLVGNWDGYSGNANNFWLYNNPSTGLLEFFPWSMDDLFGRDNPFNNSDPNSVAPTVFETAALTNRLWQIPGVAQQYETRINELLATVWDETALLAEIDRMELLITPIAGDLSAPIGATRTWISGRAAKVAADFVNGPPAVQSPLADKFCLEIQGNLAADFSATYEDPLSTNLPSGSTFTPTSFQFQGSSQLTPLATAFGFDPAVGAGKLTLRPIALTGFPAGLVFNIAIDAEDVVANTPQPVAVSDSIASFLLFLDASTSNVFPIGIVVNNTIDMSQVDLTPGGTVAGSLTSDLAVWVPVPEPGMPIMGASGLVTLAALARHRARRLRRNAS